MACGTGTGTTGNFDLGIYDRDGGKLVSAGSTAKTTASSERIVNVTDTLIPAGLMFLAMATDGTANYIAYSLTGLTVSLCKFLGLRQMETAFALPATATYATITGAFVPVIGAYLRSF